MTLLSSTQGRPGAAVDFVVAVDGCWLRVCRCVIVLWWLLREKGRSRSDAPTTKSLAQHLAHYVMLATRFLFFLHKGFFVYMELLDFVFSFTKVLFLYGVLLCR
jgi:hypothetical protein